MDKYAFHMCLPVHKETPNLDGTVQGESQTTEITHWLRNQIGIVELKDNL